MARRHCDATQRRSGGCRGMRTERKNRWEREGKRGEETGQGGCQRGISEMKFGQVGERVPVGYVHTKQVRSHEQ
jgi:hypothetical protein